jgi:tetratricopeptide (TPR) repeat protein
MKRILIILAAVFAIAPFAFSQQTQADMEKMQKQLQERMAKRGKDTAGNQRMQNLLDQQRQISAAMANSGANNAAGQSTSYGDPGDYSNVDNWKFPARKTALLSALPKKVLTRTELLSFLNNLYVQVSKRLAPGIATSVQSIEAKYGNDGSKMEDAAIYGWYTKYREEALLLIIRAAAASPDDGLLLNNCSAILNMTGLEESAVPILKYILQSYPENGMVLNNLGQAYAGLGETDTAMVYLGRAIRALPDDPEANNTAGQIEAAKGNNAKAADYFEQSIKGAYNKSAALKLRKIKSNAKLAPLVRPRVKIPEYFNEFKYKLPAQCTTTDKAADAEAEHTAFRKMISAQLKVFGNQQEALQKTKYSEGMQIMKSGGSVPNIKKDDFIAQPYHDLCGTMSKEVTSDYGSDLDDLGQRVDKKYDGDFKALENEYQVKLKAIKDGYAEKENRCCGEGRSGSCCPTAEEKCASNNELANQYLPKFAVLTEEWQKANQLVFRTHYDEVMYWGYLYYHPGGDDGFRLQVFYPVVMQYLSMLYKIGNTRIINPCKVQPTVATADSNAIREMECPIDLEIGFGVGRMILNCKKFGINGGVGALFGYERDFTVHQSTVSVGVGFKLDLGLKAGPLKAGVSAGVSETAFITFDGKNGLSDAGLKNEAKATAGATGVGKAEVSVGSKLGIRSGWSFNEGRFSGTGAFGPK